MKLALPALPTELTEAGWKNQSVLFRPDVNLDKPLRAFAVAYAAVQHDLPDDKFPPVYKALLTAQAALRKRADTLHAYAGKTPAVQKATLDQIKKVQTAASKILTVIEAMHQRAEDARKVKKPAGRGTVRVQLQQSTKHLWNSGNNGSITAKDTVAKLDQLYRDMRRHVSDPAWEKALVPAIHKITGLVKQAQKSGGMKPRGSGNQLRATFKFDSKEYRVDLEIHGDDDLDFFT